MVLPVTDSSSSATELQATIHRARSGDREAIGKVLERFRPFLLQIANEELEPQLKQKAGGSDLVQLSLMEATQAIGKFDGSSPVAFAHWLRRILLNNLANHRRSFRAEKRNINREISFSNGFAESGQLNPLSESSLPQKDQLVGQEELRLVAEAFESLDRDYQNVIRLRNEAKLSYQEIGLKMDRSADAARKLWARAIESLKDEIDKRERK